MGRGNGAKADPVTYQTAEADIFVGGDVYTGPRFAIDVIACGREGAISIHRFVQPEQAVKNFRNPHQVLTEEQIKLEASRCLGCGATIVDQNKCIGCGICTTKCQFDAISLRRDHPENAKMVPCEDTVKTMLPYVVKREIKIIKKKLTK